MVNRTSKVGDSSTATSNVPSRTASPANVTTSPRVSIDTKQEDVSNAQSEACAEPHETHTAHAEGLTQQDERLPTTAPSITPPIVGSARPSLDSGLSRTYSSPLIIPLPNPIILCHRQETLPQREKLAEIFTESTKSSLDVSRDEAADVDSPPTNVIQRDADLQTPEEYHETIEQMRSDYEAAELRRQEEMHEYLERIDALQSKLQYLSREAAEIARNASSTAEYGSAEQKLAAKDQKIALLMEEGHKLSQTELKHMSIIKKLRSKSVDDEKQLSESRRLTEKHDRTLHEAQQRAKRAEAAERRATERTKSVPKLERDLEIMREERDSKASLIARLQRELSDAQQAAQEADSKAQSEALEAERKRNAELADELSRIRLEKEMTQKNNLTEIRDLKEKLERDRERARIAEIERQGEQNVRTSSPGLR